MRIFALAGTLKRKGSVNRRLLELAVELCRGRGVELDHALLAELEMPLYCEDERQEQGFPPGAEELRRRLESADGVLLASPEYNYSIPGVLKNAIDWTSRYRPVPWRGKHALLLSASPSLVGGNRGLWALRVPLECMGVHVYPEMFSLAHADEAFDSGGQLNDAQLQRRLEQTLEGFLALVRRVTG